MFRFIGLCLGTLVRLLRARRSLLLENLALRQQLAVLKRRHPRPSLGTFDRLFWGSCSPSLVRLEAVPHHRHAGNRGPLAPSGFSSLLEDGFKSQAAGWEKTDIQGDTGSDLPHGRLESDLGCTPHPRR